MSDGGDGFGQVMGDLLGAATQTVRTVDAAHRACVSKWWWEPRSRTAIIESATAIGLAMLPPGKLHPFVLDTFGLAGLMRAAAAKGARHCVLGIGGSATNDGGFGLARALGWEFLDAKNRPIEQWTRLGGLARIRGPRRRRWFRTLTVAVDVQNPLLGLRGASRVYGPQKGLRPRDFARAESCLRRLAAIVEQDWGLDLARVPGAGAAGGLGFGLPAFAGAKLTPGFELFARTARLDGRVRRADLVVTGEGAIDRSTLMGKGVSQVAERCRKNQVPCIGLAGALAVSRAGLRIFAQAHALTDLTSVEEAKGRPELWLRRLARRVAGAL